MNAATGARLPPGWTAVDPLPESAASAAVVALRVVTPDGTPAWLHTVVGEIDNATRRRLRSEQPALQELLGWVASEPAGAVLLPWFVYGDPATERPYVACARPGPTFAESLTRGPMPSEQVVGVALACADALHELHRRGRAHGLVSPQSLHQDSSDGDTVRLGSPLPPALAELVAVAGGTGHEPPEVLRGGEPDAAADVFGLASTCWTLLSGRPPFGAAGDHLARLTAAEPPPLLRTDVPPAMDSALRAALSPDPVRRPDLRTLAQALRIVEDGSASVSEVAPPPAAPQPSDDRQDTLAPTRPVTDAGRPLGSRYLLDSLIGRGATGHVWRGHTRDDARPVAVKLLRSELAEDPEVVTRFMRERAALMRLAHPHLVGIEDLVAEGGALAIVMELVEGRDLRSVLGGGPLPTRRAATLLSQTASALAAVHAAGMVHRDLKPENILVEDTPGEPTARLTDFGLARAVESSVLTRQTQLVGTPAYISPEVVAGRSPGPAVDVYAFGVTAYEVLAGRRPFAGGSTAAVLRAHLDEAPRRPDELSPQLWALVEGCLRKDPADRPAAADLAQAWGRVAAGESPTAPAPAPVPVAPAASAPAPRRPDDAAAGQPVETPLRTPGTAAEPAHPQPDELQSSTGVQQTETTARPLTPRHAGPAAESGRGRRFWLLIAAAVVVVGFALGFTVVALGGDDRAPAGQLPDYPLAATVGNSPAGPLVRWTVPKDVAGDDSVILIFDATASGAKRAVRTRNALPASLTSYNDAALTPGSCVVVYVINPAKAPSEDAAAKPGCVPAASATATPNATPTPSR